MTSAKFSGFLTPSALVSILDQSIVLKSRNLPYCVRIWATPSLPLSSDVICEWPLSLSLVLKPKGRHHGRISLQNQDEKVDEYRDAEEQGRIIAEAAEERKRRKRESENQKFMVVYI